CTAPRSCASRARPTAPRRHKSGWPRARSSARARPAGASRDLARSHTVATAGALDARAGAGRLRVPARTARAAVVDVRLRRTASLARSARAAAAAARGRSPRTLLIAARSERLEVELGFATLLPPALQPSLGRSHIAQHAHVALLLVELGLPLA